jgi:cation:H+ antiporter
VTSAIPFLASAAAIVVAGAVLSRQADVIAERTGIARVWIGSILLAGATSLPELATDVSAVRLDAADLAAGDLFGSSMANMLILALIELVAPRRKVFRTVTLDHALAACLALVLTAAALVLVVLHPARAWGGLVPPSTLLVVAYALGTRAIYRHVSREGAGGSPEAGDPAAATRPGALRSPIARFALAALVILVVAPVFARSAKELAVATGLGNSVVGAWLVGLATSLPELVTSVAAVRIGALDLAVGNLFGSNGFNMAIFFALDLVSPGGSVWAALSPVQLVTGLCGLILTGLGLAAIVYRAERRFAMLEPDAYLLVAAYLLGLAVVERYAATMAP